PWQYQCLPYYAESALHPIIVHLERALGFDRDDPPGAKLDKLERFLEVYARPRLDANLLGHLLGLPAEARYGTLSMTPERQKHETLRALNDILATPAQDRCGLML